MKSFKVSNKNIKVSLYKLTNRKKFSGSNVFRSKSQNKRPHRSDSSKNTPQPEGGDSNGPTPVKAARMVGGLDLLDPNSSDHVVAVTQLKEKIALLQKQISVKDGQLLTKDKQVGIHFCRTKFFLYFVQKY